MNKILIFYGSNREFMEICPPISRNLTDVVMELDSDNKKMIVHIPQLEKDEDEDKSDKMQKIKIENFVIHSDEYSGVREHVIINFTNFIAKLEIKNMYIQNPPKHVSEQLHRIYDTQNIIEDISQSYRKVTEDVIIQFNDNFDNKIIGQEKVKSSVLQALYPLVENRQKKPVVMLFYGDTGIGKTETANYISELLKGKIMRKQFSMYQNNQFATYLFGGSNNEGSFAKDLLDRDSNVILLDEFDKANVVFHSAFYQLFDDGIYEDGNYKVILDYGIIICTSNYRSEKEIIEHLGSAIFNRFDAVVHFEDLSIEAKERIGLLIIHEFKELYEESGVEISKEVIARLKEAAVCCTNVREIRRLVKNTFSLFAVRKLCTSKE